MTVSPEILNGPRLKVQRAYRHIEEIVSKTAPLCKDWHRVSMKPCTLPGEDNRAGFALRYEPTQPIDQLVALIIGDAVHNLRGALDHLATGIRSSTTWQSQGHFPMRQDRNELITPKGNPIEDLDAIEAALPGAIHLLLDEIRPTNGHDESFWAFHTLNNNDKHNLILPTVTMAKVSGVNANLSGVTIQDAIVRADATNPINLIVSDKPFSIKEDFNTIVEVKFGDGTPFKNDPVAPTLSNIARVVSDTLDKFETLIRKQC